MKALVYFSIAEPLRIHITISSRSVIHLYEYFDPVIAFARCMNNAYVVQTREI